MSNENNIRYGFPKINKNGELVGFKTYTTCVYDMNGKLIRKHVKSLSELPKGTYIVDDGSVTTKVVRR